RPAVQQRREHLQLGEWRRDAVVSNQRGTHRRRKGLVRQPLLLSVLLQPLRIPPLAHFVTWGAHYGADPVGAREARWCHPPARPGMAVRVQASREERSPP